MHRPVRGAGHDSSDFALLAARRAVGTHVLFIRHRRRRTRQSAKLLREKVVLESSEDPHTSRKRWFACFLATTVAWITIFLCTFNSSTAKTSTSMSAAQARPRTVFSFTTTPRGIDEMQRRGRTGASGGRRLRCRVRHRSTDVPRQGGGHPHLVTSRHVDAEPNRVPWGHVRHGDKSIPSQASVYRAGHGLWTGETGPGDDHCVRRRDRIYPPQLCERALHYTHKYPNDAIAVLGGWISAEDGLYCGRSLAIGVNSVSFVGGAGGVAVKRKFFGMGEATMPAFEVANMSKACYLGDDYYLSHLLSRNGVRRRLTLTESFSHGGLSYAPSEHPGGANVEHYQQCIRELGKNQDLSRDGEFGSAYMFLFSRTWGVLRGLRNLYFGGEFYENYECDGGELRLYKEPYFKRLRLLIKVSAGNLCYDMSCDGIRDVISSARWTGLPATGSTLPMVT
ncbi:hypothetical protein GQ600_22985 [Phytophthora cactorum]|nr:hypothetical protein GQ600_22985 [Phytophthora cactorum]